MAQRSRRGFCAGALVGAWRCEEQARAQSTAHVAAATLQLQRVREHRRGLLAQRAVRVFSSARVRACERTLHAGAAAAAQLPRLR
jgi:hypothetical protein